MEETETMAYIQTARDYTRRSMEKPDERKLYSTQNSPRLSEPQHHFRSRKIPQKQAVFDEEKITSQTVEMNKKSKPPKLYRDLNSVEDILDRFEIKQEESAAIRFASSDEKLSNIYESNISLSLFIYRTRNSQSIKFSFY